MSGNAIRIKLVQCVATGKPVEDVVSFAVTEGGSDTLPQPHYRKIEPFHQGEDTAKEIHVLRRTHKLVRRPDAPASRSWPHTLIRGSVPVRE